MDFSNIGSTLKKLDELDSELYAGKKSTSKVEEKKDINKSSVDLSDANLNDFDDDDSDDLADLLYDDTDILPTKKSPEKFVKNEAPPISPKKMTNAFKETDSPVKNKLENSKKGISFDFLNSVDDNSLGTSNQKKSELKNILSKTVSYKDIESIDNSSEFLAGLKSQEEKSSTFRRQSDIPSPIKLGQNKADTLAGDETNFLRELGLDHLENISSVSTKVLEKEPKSQSPQKGQTNLKMDELDFDDDNEILDTLDFGDSGKDKSKEKTDRRTFMDDLLGTTKETTTKKSVFTLDEKYKKVEKHDDDDDADLVFGSYVPSAANSASTLAGRRRSVKFEDEVRVPKPSISSKRQDNPIKDQSILEARKSAPSRVGTQQPKPSASKEILPRRSISSKSSSEPKNEKEQKSFPPSSQTKGDLDWLGFSKDNPSTGQNTLPISKEADSDNFPEKSQGTIASSSSRRKSSGADWLGISGATFADKKLPSAESATKLRTNKSTSSAVGILSNQKNHDQSLASSKQTDEIPPWLLDSAQATTPKREVKNTTPSFIETPQPIPSNQIQATVSDATTQQQSLPNTALLQKTPLNAATDNMEVPSWNVLEQAPTLAAGQYMLTRGSSTQLQASHALSSQQPLASNENTLLPLHNMLNSLQLERDHLLKSADVTKLKNEEEMKLREATYKNRQKEAEEEFQQKLKRVKEEHEADIQNLKTQLIRVEGDNKKLVTNQDAKIKDIEREHKKEVERLKDLHNQSISAMQQDHEAALSRLKQLKDQEVEAISSTQVYARSLQNLTNQLEARAAELSQLQLRVDDRHQMALQERQVQLASKEKDLKALEVRLRRQLEEGDEERARLQQLVLRLENRLQQQTKDGEEDRWDVQQMKAKLEVHQRILEEEQKMHLKQIEREKDKLRLAQDSLLSEQKVVLLQLAQERQQLSAEKIELESLSKRVKEEEGRLNAKKFQSEGSLESQRRFLQQEEDKVRVEREVARHESQQLQREHEALEREKRQMRDEREKFDDLRLELRRRAEEVEEMAVRASSDREEGRSALIAARKIESDHNMRMNQLMQQIQRLVEKERHLLTERENLGEERMHLEKRKDSMLCASCKLAVSLPLMALPPSLSQMRRTPSLMNATLPTHPNVDPNLMVWYVTAEKDREFLQEELSFLKSLKEFGKSSTK